MTAEDTGEVIKLIKTTTKEVFTFFLSFSIFLINMLLYHCNHMKRNLKYVSDVQNVLINNNKLPISASSRASAVLSLGSGTL